MVRNTQKQLLLSCGLFALTVLGCSYMAEYVWKLAPCHLCKLQRLPYFFLAVLPGLAQIGFRYSLIKIAIISLFAMSAMLSFYHLLVIGGLVKDVCAVQANITTMDDFWKMLDSAVPCSEVRWKFFRIPIAGYNLAASILFIVLFVKISKVSTRKVASYSTHYGNL